LSFSRAGIRRLCLLSIAVLSLLGIAPARGDIPLTSYRHDRWSLDEGAPGRINAITQSPDGFLWIGSVEGLFRFDGVVFEPIALAPAGSGHLVVSQLRTSRAGDVWIGLARGRGVRVWRDGRVIDPRMPNPSREVNDIAEDAAGGIWIARGGRGDNTLARYANGRWQEFGAAAGLPEQPVWAMLFARDGTQWVVCDATIVVRRPGQTRFAATGIAVGPRASLSEGRAGEIWLSDTRGTRRIAPEGGRPVFFPNPASIGGTRMLFDRDGNLWETTWTNGVLRIRAPGRPLAAGGADESPRLATFTAAAGLTSEQTHALFQDREGNLWIGTELGLDMLRPAAVVVEPGIPANSPTSYRLAAARDGTVYVADADGLYAIRPGAAPARLMRLRTPAEALCARRAGGVWLIDADAVLGIDGRRRAPVPKPAGIRAMGCAEDSAGRLWLPALDRGLFWRAGGAWHTWPELSAHRGVPGNIALTGAGRAAILFRAPPLARQDAPFVPLFDASSRVGGIEGLLPPPGAMLISGAQGLAVPTHGAILPAARYPWAASLNGAVQTATGDTWAIGDAGIVRLRSADLAQALLRPGRPVPTRIFDFRDGLNSFAQKAPGAQVAQGGDGRIWFLTRRNVVHIDPATLTTNHVPPAVIVRSIGARGRVYPPAADLHLPADTTGVTIAYTATSLTVPGRVAFRYRLLGQDARWIDARNQRSASFADLGPGRYTFQVIAANDDGVWNARGQSVSFTIARAFYQTWWFPILSATAILALLYLAYAARVRYLGGLIRDRLAERTLERERIARELHDTLIQGVQGLLMRFQAVADRLHDDAEAQAILLPALDRAEEMLIEGRDRVKGLRRLEERHLQRELRQVLDGQMFAASVAPALIHRGSPRRVAPEVVDDIIAIVNEALANAARHAGASIVEVHVDYGDRAITVVVRDNGAGISPEVLTAGGRDGHFGLIGMRERAARIEGRLTIESEAGQGTLLRLTIPARIAYVA